MTTAAIPVENDRLHQGFVTIGEWNTQVLAQMRYLKEVFAALNPDKIQNGGLLTDGHVTNYVVNPYLHQWNRGVGPFTLGVSVQTTADQWKAGVFSLAHGASGSVGKQTASLEAGHPDALALIYTQGSVNTEYGYIFQNIEFTNALMGRTIGVTARVSSPGGGFMRFYNGAAVTDVAIPADSSFHDVTLHATIPVGTTGHFIMFYTLASTTMTIESVGMSIGSATVRPVPLHPAEDLARCQRHYQKLVINERNYGQAAGHTINSMYRVKEPMFTTSTITVSGGTLTNTNTPGVSFPVGTTLALVTLGANAAGDFSAIGVTATLESSL